MYHPQFSPSSNRSTTTIGVLTARLSGPTEINLWHGAANMALQRQINLVFFSGGIPHGAQPYETQKNILFNIAGQRNVDGLLLWTNILSHSPDRARLENFYQQYAPLPLISMGMVLPSIPSICIDMFEGARKLLGHLIEQHGRRRIAFIRGPEVSPDAQDRYRAYLETLVHYQRPIDLRLIVSGDFGRDSGTAAVQQLADRIKTFGIL